MFGAQNPQISRLSVCMCVGGTFGVGVIYIFRIWIERPRNIRITLSGHPAPTPDRRHVPKTIIWVGISPPRFLAGFRRNPFRARRGGPVGWVSGFGFSGLNFRGSNPGGVPFFQKPRVGGRGCTSASGGRPPFILGFRVFHFWFRSSLVPHPPCWLSRLGVGFGGAKVVGSIPGRDLFFQNARRELETCRFSFPGTCPCTFLKEIHSLARVRVRSLRKFIPWHVSVYVP